MARQASSLSAGSNASVWWHSCTQVGRVSSSGGGAGIGVDMAPDFRKAGLFLSGAWDAFPHLGTHNCYLFQLGIEPSPRRKTPDACAESGLEEPILLAIAMPIAGRKTKARFK